jgi:hypothetical protein
MKRLLPFVAALVLLIAPLGGQERVNRDGAEQQQRPAPRIGNPGNVVQQLMRMTPEQRERALEKLPPARQARIREQLQRFDSLPKAEQERRLRLAEMFANLPPEKQDLVRRQIKAFNELPEDRRRVVGPAFQRLRRMTEAERQAVMTRPAFQRRFTPAEQQMLGDLSANLPPAAGELPRP